MNFNIQIPDLNPQYDFSVSYCQNSATISEYEDELNIDDLLIPNLKESTHNAFEKYTMSSNCLPRYEASSPLVKYLEHKSGSFSFKQFPPVTKRVVEEEETSFASTHSHSASSNNVCQNTIDLLYSEASEEHSLAMSP